MKYDDETKSYDLGRTPKTIQQLKGRRTQARAERRRRARGNVIKTAGALLAATLVVGVGPKAVKLANHEVREGLDTAVVNVSTFGAVTGDNIKSAANVPVNVMAAVKNQASTIWNGQDKMAEGQNNSAGLSRADREALGAQAVRAMQEGDQMKAGETSFQNSEAVKDSIGAEQYGGAPLDIHKQP